MITTFGKQPTSLPAGFFKAVRFPVLALLDSPTGDGRLLDSGGAGSRNLPLSIRAQFTASYGHEGAVISGALFEVTIDPDSGVMSGSGFLLNDPAGRQHARMIATHAMDKNSVDLADVTARFEEDLSTGEVVIRFTKFNLSATTGVATPAFATAYAEVDPLTDEELMASLIGEDPMVPLVAVAVSNDFSIALPDTVEITASGAPRQPFDVFYIPEADVPTKIIVTETGVVYGHLGLWESCHDGIEGVCVRIPRPTDGYASFNKPGVLTDRGMVETGPIFAYGGHRRAQGAPDLAEAYGGIENTWADVRITEGMHGPWVSGIVRPGVDDSTVYAARASRISGHWVGGKLKAIVSVNAEGFDVAGTGDGVLDMATGFAFSTDDTGVAELVASFPDCVTAIFGSDNTYTITTTALTNGTHGNGVRGTWVSGTSGSSLPITMTFGIPQDVTFDKIVVEEAPSAPGEAAILLSLLLDDDD